MADKSNSVVASRVFKTVDQHGLKLDAKFHSESADITVTMVEMEMDEQGQLHTGERARSFQAALTLSYPQKNASLVFHDADPKASSIIHSPEFFIPGTVVDGFWLRESLHTKEALKEAAFDRGISPQLKELLQPALNDLLGKVVKGLSTINLEEVSEKKGGGLLGRKPVEYHLNFKEFNQTFMQQVILQANPNIQQIVYCLGRHSKKLKQDWRTALEKYGAPKSVSMSDLESEKWHRRFCNLQDADLFTDQQKVNWKRVDHTTEGGKYLMKFIEKLFRAPKFGLEAMKGDLGILTPESTESTWKVASMARLLYYYHASLQQSRSRKS